MTTPAPTAPLLVGQFMLPEHILTPLIKKIQFGSAVAALTSSEPMKFGVSKFWVFDTDEAEYVGEGQNKSSGTLTSTVKKVEPYKFQKTFRYSEEVVWADEDEQANIIADMASLIAPKLARALDYGVFYGIDPKSGVQAAAMAEYLNQTTHTVALGTGTAVAAIDAADQEVLGSRYMPDGITMGTRFAGLLGSQRVELTGQKMFPDLRYTTEVSNLEGHQVSVSDTVNVHPPDASDTGVLAFVGDFDVIRWGIQRSIGLTLIQYGDPDGNGDLKRNNQVAIRAEVVYGWGIGDLAAFAKITP